MELVQLNLLSDSVIGLLYEVVLNKKVGFFKTKIVEIKSTVFVKKEYNPENILIGYNRNAIESKEWNDTFGTDRIGNRLYTPQHLRDLILHDYKLLHENKSLSKLNLTKEK